MDREGKFYICVWAIIVTGIILALGLFTINGRSNNLTEIEKVSACAKAGFEWRPIMLPGSSTQTMSCVKPNGGN